jgi:hypothetical protein
MCNLPALHTRKKIVLYHPIMKIKYKATGFEKLFKIIFGHEYADSWRQRDLLADTPTGRVSTT